MGGVACAQGMEQVVPRRYLALFTPTELAQRVCGTATLDVAELKRTATYSGLSPLDPSVRYFWDALEAFTPAQVRLPLCHCPSPLSSFLCLHHALQACSRRPLPLRVLHRVPPQSSPERGIAQSTSY